MKPLGLKTAQFKGINLYPTTFRWNSKKATRKDRDSDIYIPLRSDETGIHIPRLEHHSPFISHYVQMKPAFQDQPGPAGTDLYPTTFRWNRLWTGTSFISTRIYIPLRSDETQTVATGCHCFGRFISHYVQMKLSASAVALSPAFYLYPTTFRWNVEGSLLRTAHSKIYIPLRSDETRRGANETEQQINLYPTTFRWNLYSQMRFLSPKILFISHYVQMKPIRIEVPEVDIPNLYPTTFRWNNVLLPCRVCGLRIYIPLRSDETTSLLGMKSCGS